MTIRIILSLTIMLLLGCSDTPTEESNHNNGSSFEVVADNETNNGSNGQTPSDEDSNDDENGNIAENSDDDSTSHDDHASHDGNHHGSKCKHKGHGRKHGRCDDIKVTDIIINVREIILKGGNVTTSSPATGMNAFSLVNGPLKVTPAANVSPRQIRLLLNDSGNFVKDNEGHQFPLKTPSQQEAGLKILMPVGISMQANTTYKVNYQLSIERQIVSAGKKCLLKPVLKGIGIEPVGSTGGGTTGTTTGTTDGGTTGSTGTTTGGTSGGTTTGSTTGTTGGDVCQACFACITAGGTLESCTPPCNIDCF